MFGVERKNRQNDRQSKNINDYNEKNREERGFLHLPVVTSAKGAVQLCSKSFLRGRARQTPRPAAVMDENGKSHDVRREQHDVCHDKDPVLKTPAIDNEPRRRCELPQVEPFGNTFARVVFPLLKNLFADGENESERAQPADRFHFHIHYIANFVACRLLVHLSMKDLRHSVLSLFSALLLTSCAHVGDPVDEATPGGYYLDHASAASMGGVGNYVQRSRKTILITQEGNSRSEAGVSAREQEAGQAAPTSTAPSQEELPLTLKDGILFKTGKSELPPEMKEELIHLARLLGEHKKNRIQVDGYADSVGTSESNIVLSRKRAAAVQDLMIQNGLRQDQVTATGFGTSHPVAPNTSPEGRARNRRVELHVETG